MSKKCTKCGEEKKESEFYDHHKISTRDPKKRKFTYIKRRPSDGKRGKCKQCICEHRKKVWNDRTPEKRKEWNLKGKFGLTIEEYNRILYSQGGGCAICAGEINGKGGVDHCHKTGKIRGILCAHCNVAIGNMDDDIEKLGKAIQYLQKWR